MSLHWMQLAVRFYGCTDTTKGLGSMRLPEKAQVAESPIIIMEKNREYLTFLLDINWCLLTLQQVSLIQVLEKTDLLTSMLAFVTAMTRDLLTLI